MTDFVQASRSTFWGVAFKNALNGAGEHAPFKAL